MKFEEHPDLIAAAAAANGVSVDLILHILRLEPHSRNLHAYGNRPTFRRALAKLVEEAWRRAEQDRSE